MDYEKYFDMVEKGMFTEAVKYKCSQIPNALYKYYSLNDDLDMNDKKIKCLVNNEIYLADFNSLNDLFEGKFLIFNEEELKSKNWNIDSFETYYKEIINKNKINVFKDNKKIKLKFVKLDDSNGNISLGNYDYYMLKEIDEEPDRLLDLSNKIEKEVPSELLDCLRNEKIMILGSGTSYHAGLYAKKWFKAANMIASEFVYDDKEYDNYTFVLLSQSGETFDLIKAIEKIRSGQNNKIISLINKENTTIERLSDFYLNLHAQPEIAVASTKVYLNEVVALYILYQILNNKEYKDSIKELVENLKKVSANKDYIYEYAKKISKVKNAYFVGRGFDYKLALEASLKLKEVSYIHSEATYAGELKHGPIALIDKNFLTIFMITDKKFNDIIDSNISEINARFGKIMILSTTGIESKYDGFIVDYHSDLSGLVLIMFAQYLSYYVALNRKLNIDKPKNLAKSVTVE